MNEHKLEILQKYEHVYDKETLKLLHKNPIIFSKRKFRVELEKLYNEHTRRLLRTKSPNLSLSQTLKKMHLINDKKTKAVEFGVRMIYSADKYSAQLPEAGVFLECLSQRSRKKLFLYLLLRLVYKINLRVTFLDHLKGNTSFDSFPVSFVKAKKLIQIACQKDPVLVKNLGLHLESRFEPDEKIPYFSFLTEFATFGSTSADFNIFGELVKVHLGKRKIFRKNRFEEAKQNSQNPFERTPTRELVETQKMKADMREEDFKSTRKINSKSTSRTGEHGSSRPKSKSRSKSRSRVASKGSFRAQETRKSTQRRFSPKPEKRETLPKQAEESEKLSILKVRRRKPLLAQVEQILEERIHGNEQMIIGKIEEEIRLKSEKVLNKFISRFSVEKSAIDLYGHNLGYTIISKAQLAMAFVITREMGKFLTLMRQSLRETEENREEDSLGHWEGLVGVYRDSLEHPSSESLVKQLVIQLFKFPSFKNEIVFLLKYFFKVKR